MSKTMSNPTEWMQFYNPNFSTPQPSTAAGSSSPPAPAPPAPTPTTRLSPESGRVSKPVRRRTRASRRTPTTLLNTDTANFRAMVQQFTGGPTAGPPHHVTSAAGYPSLYYQPPPQQLVLQQQQQQHGFFGGGAAVGPVGRPVGTTGMEGFLMGSGGGASARGLNPSGSPGANYSDNNGNNINFRSNNNNNFMF